jgi:CMP-N-acetylneuraminic acid synthetase
MSAIGIITAKSYSSRIPSKNKKLFGNKPLFYYALNSAVKSNCFERVYVSTDDSDIAGLASNIKGVDVDIRPEHIRGDEYSVPQVVSELIQRLGNVNKFNVICIINPCCPLTQPFHFREALEVFNKSDALVLESVVKARFNPVYSYQIENGFLVKGWNAKRIQSNNSKPFFFGNGAFVILRVATIVQNETFFLSPSIPYIMDEIYSYDIDTLEDFHLVNAQMQRLLKSNELEIL